MIVECKHVKTASHPLVHLIAGQEATGKKSIWKVICFHLTNILVVGKIC